MEPYLKSSDIITYSNSTSFDNLEIGDVIIFRAPEATTEDGYPEIFIHRISDIGTYFGKKVITAKGDANLYSIPGIDFPIFAENYIGKVVSVTNNTIKTTKGEPFSELILDKTRATTLDFSVKPLDNWAYQNARYDSNVLGFGINNAVEMWPNHFDNLSVVYGLMAKDGKPCGKIMYVNHDMLCLKLVSNIP